MKRLRILRNLGKNPSNGMTGRLRRCILNWNSFRTEWIPTCSELKVENPMWIFERWCGIAAFCLHFRRLFFHLCCICVAFVLHLCCIYQGATVLSSFRSPLFSSFVFLSLPNHSAAGLFLTWNNVTRRPLKLILN